MVGRREAVVAGVVDCPWRPHVAPRAGNAPAMTGPAASGPAVPSALGAARAELKADIARGAGGRSSLERYADRVDELIRRLVAEAPPGTGPVSVAAIGGYGRRHLCLHSDLDIFVLFRDAIREPDEAFLRAVLHPLWDAGVVVGHQVRELKDFEHLERDHGCKAYPRAPVVLRCASCDGDGCPNCEAPMVLSE